MTVTLVAAVARNGVIGADGDMPWRLPGELRLFKQVTMDHVLVMGRATYDAIGRALPGRTTVVVTRQHDWQPPGGRPPGVRVAGSVEDALSVAADVDDQVFVVGGGQIYAQALSFADRLRITWVDAEPEGDTYFPALDWAGWQRLEREEHDGWAVETYRRAEAR